MSRQILFFAAALAASLATACEEGMPWKNGQAPTQRATLDVIPGAMQSGSELRGKISKFAAARGLRQVVVTAMPLEAGGVTLRLDEARCKTFTIIALGGGGFDRQHVLIDLDEFDRRKGCSKVADAGTTWSQFLEMAGSAKEVTRVRNGVSEFTPAPIQTVDQYNRTVSDRRPPGQPDQSP